MKEVRYIRGEEDVADARGRVYLIGKFITATHGGNSPPVTWRMQKPRKASKSKTSGAADIGLAIHQSICDAFLNNKKPDVRIAYDGYINWVLANKEDVCLIAGAVGGEDLWVTVITKENGDIESIRESQVSLAGATDVASEVERKIRELTPKKIKTVVAIDGIDLGPSVENIGNKPLELAKTPADLGHIRLTKLDIGAPIVALCSSIIISALMIGLPVLEMKSIKDDFVKITSSVEGEYQKGVGYLKLLESQKGFLASSGESRLISEYAGRTLSGLAAYGDLLFLGLKVNNGESTLSVETSVSAIPVPGIAAPAQAEPIVSTLASSLNSEVKMKGAGIETFRKIAKDQVFRRFNLVADINKDTL